MRRAHRLTVTPQVTDATPVEVSKAIDPVASGQVRRPVFPYSVIPGGVRDEHELATAVAKDPVAARHYAGFNLAKARTVKNDRALAMYVSYRLNNRVFWTKQPMKIPAGEMLISDGENFARVRCGNRLSMVAVKPVSVSEPTVEKLETPEFVPPLLAQFDGGEGSNTLPGAPVAVPDSPLLPPDPKRGFSVPPILQPAVFPPQIQPNIPPPPPVGTPEPGTFILLLGGTALIGGIAGLLRK